MARFEKTTVAPVYVQVAEAIGREIVGSRIRPGERNGQAAALWMRRHARDFRKGFERTGTDIGRLIESPSRDQGGRLGPVETVPVAAGKECGAGAACR